MIRFLKGFLVALFGSIGANLVLMMLLRPLVINPEMPLHALSVMPIVMLTTIGVIGATVVYGVLRMVLTAPDKPFIWISGIVLFLSFIPDYLIIGKTTGPFAGGSPGTAAVLAMMHVVSAVIIVAALTYL